ncbi:MAG: gliding motility-associated C-terminal domain-containing protein [Chitinophagaceae bacterium]|nr:gliding motility-associated C-terminal domain-containing protein [Chitinophagaceae bacterium]
MLKCLKHRSYPNIFSPNGDGVHDRWDIPFLESYPGCTIDVVNRYGQLVIPLSRVYHCMGRKSKW